MEIIAHRGFWKIPEEKNTIEAILHAFENGFGVETDIRDYCGELVISHNIPGVEAPTLSNILEAYHSLNSNVSLALNIKADGIQTLLDQLLRRYKVSNYFLFDMSIPELMVNEASGLTYFTRNSDIERECVMYSQASGVWLDSFYDDSWLDEGIIRQHISNGKRICIVSSELHLREYSRLWKMLKDNKFHESRFISLCTDLPDKARRYFCE